jgi:hypothetical protein
MAKRSLPRCSPEAGSPCSAPDCPSSVWFFMAIRRITSQKKQSPPGDLKPPTAALRTMLYQLGLVGLLRSGIGRRVPGLPVQDPARAD